VVGMVDGNEYKRRQSPPGLKVTPRAFGRDRRLPISQAFRKPGRKAGKPAAEAAGAASGEAQKPAARPRKRARGG